LAEGRACERESNPSAKALAADAEINARAPPSLGDAAVEERAEAPRQLVLGFRLVDQGPA
jgi:hypothetical protein